MHVIRMSAIKAGFKIPVLSERLENFRKFKKFKKFEKTERFEEDSSNRHDRIAVEIVDLFSASGSDARFKGDSWVICTLHLYKISNELTS